MKPKAKEEKEKFSCECIKCGHKVQSDKHCKDIKCSECGGEMRRAERPGPGRMAKLEHKQFPITELKTFKNEAGALVMQGYANSKGKKDRYGDVPTVFSKLRSYVYELKDYKNNAVVLLNHENKTSGIAGSMNTDVGGFVLEDDKGLKFQMVFSQSDFAPVAHARTVYEEGHGRALSIGGEWAHEDKENPGNLTHADIFEISLVGVGADANALMSKGLPGEKGEARNLEDCIADFAESIKAGRVLSKVNEDKLKAVMEEIAGILKSLEKEAEEPEKVISEIDKAAQTVADYINKKE